MIRIIQWTILPLILTFVGCDTSSTKFNGDSAYQLLEQQCDYGPRNPGSDGYYQCKDFYIKYLSNYADTVFTQKFSYTELKERNTYEMSNIIAQFNSNGNEHLLLGAHWDTRPWADSDPNFDNRTKPILGANDGASGVAILLELAKMFSESHPNKKISIVLFDGEDLGVEGIHDSYAQGSKYFASNLPIDKPDYGIIVDMIGDKILEIPIERNSYRVAPELISELWEIADQMNYPAFQNRLGYDVYDDHIPLWEIAGIPTVNLIDMNYPNRLINYWHTMNDVPGNCSAKSLEQVGSVIAKYIYDN